MKKLFLASFILASVIACGDNANNGGSINSEGTNSTDTSTINSGGAGENNMTDSSAMHLDSNAVDPNSNMPPNLK